MNDVLLNQDLIFRIIDLTGVVGAGAFGGTVARQHRFDLVGFLILGIGTGLGGGILRDLMLNLTPVALTDKAYLLGAVSGVVISMLLQVDGRKIWVQLFGMIDAVTIGCWAATGATKTLAAGLGVGPALLLSVTTAVGGGVIRDVLVGRTPEVFGGNTLYATPALAGAGVVTIVHGIGYPGIGMIAGTLTGIALCLPARWFGWSLPTMPDWSLDSAAANMLRKVKGDKSRRARAHRDALENSDDFGEIQTTEESTQDDDTGSATDSVDNNADTNADSEGVNLSQGDGDDLSDPNDEGQVPPPPLFDSSC